MCGNNNHHQKATHPKKKISERKKLQKRYHHTVKLCCDYIVSKLSINTCIDTTLFAAGHDFHELENKSVKFIDENFEKVFTSDEFLELSSDQIWHLIPLLEYNKMAMSDVRNAILLWVAYKRRNRKKYMDALFGLLDSVENKDDRPAELILADLEARRD